MNKILFLSALISVLVFSCLKKDSFDVEAFGNSNINDVAGVWFRYITKEPSGREVLNKVELDGITRTVDTTAKKVTLKVAPSQARLNAIPADQRDNLSIKNVAVVVSLPTAARIFPVGNSPVLGTNGDWSNPNKYRVVAANGTETEWTIHMTELKK